MRVARPALPLAAAAAAACVLPAAGRQKLDPDLCCRPCCCCSLCSTGYVAQAWVKANGGAGRLAIIGEEPVRAAGGGAAGGPAWHAWAAV